MRSSKKNYGRIGALMELIEISHAVGSDPDLVQGGGGNTSVKSRDGKTIFVKASGTTLEQMDRSRGWAEMDLDATRAVIKREDLHALPTARRESEVLRLLQAAVRWPSGARPSVESGLHAILDRVVVHTHPIGLNAFLCSRDSRKRFRGIFGKVGGEPLYVPYVDPGYTLAAQLDRDIAEYVEKHGKLPAVVLLENHGLFVAAPEPDACLRLSRRIADLGRKWIGGKRINSKGFTWLRTTPRRSRVSTGDAERKSSAPTPGLPELRGALLRAGVAPGVLRRDDSSVASDFLATAGHAASARKGAFTPDQIVYCRTNPLVLQPRRASDWESGVRTYRERHDVDPRVIIIDGVAVCYMAPSLAELRVIAEVYRGAMVTMLRGKKGGGARFLDRGQARFIEEWEAENYRSSVLSGKATQLKGRIAVVTGASSYASRLVTTGLVQAGATVIACDSNTRDLDKVAAQLPSGRVLPLQAITWDESGVSRAFRTIEDAVGGIDYMVHCATEAATPALLDISIASWSKLVDLDINSAFLCTREASRLLKRQRAGGAMVSIAGGPASIEGALEQRWAAELAESDIRINRVIPREGKESSDELVNSVLFLLSANARGINGQTITVAST